MSIRSGPGSSAASVSSSRWHPALLLVSTLSLASRRRAIISLAQPGRTRRRSLRARGDGARCTASGRRRSGRYGLQPSWTAMPFIFEMTRDPPWRCSRASRGSRGGSTGHWRRRAPSAAGPATRARLVEVDGGASCSCSRVVSKKSRGHLLPLEPCGERAVDTSMPSTS